MRRNPHLLVKLRNVDLLSAIVEWIHYDFHKELIHFIEELLDLLLILVVLVE